MVYFSRNCTNNIVTLFNNIKTIWFKFKFCFNSVHANFAINTFIIYEFSCHRKWWSGTFYLLQIKAVKKNKKANLHTWNAGTESLAKNINIDISDFNSVFETIKNYEIDIVIVGPEQPLVDGIVDFLSEKCKSFGPDKFASQLEGSKVFMKDLS